MTHTIDTEFDTLDNDYPSIMGYFTVRVLRGNRMVVDIEKVVQNYLYGGFVALNARLADDTREDDYSHVLVDVRVVLFAHTLGDAGNRVAYQRGRLHSSGYMTTTDPIFYLPVKEA